MPPKSPLAQRNGLDPAWLRTDGFVAHAPSPWATMRDWLDERLRVHMDVDASIDEGRFVLADGQPVRAADPYTPYTFVWFHRDLREEATVPGKIHTVFEDERIMVVDKPPFLSSIPRGRHVMQSVVVRLRAELGLPELTPMHRLDRVTSGLLLLAKERQWRGPYQSMFQYGQITKTYRAIAPLREDLAVPTTVRSHIVKEHGVMRASEIAGSEPNSESLVELVGELTTGTAPKAYQPLPGVDGDVPIQPRLGEYKLSPITGKTHQLRIHLASLGIPIVGDPLYLVERDVTIDDFTTPLQLLANQLSFTDPIDGTERTFESARSLPLLTNE